MKAVIQILVALFTFWHVFKWSRGLLRMEARLQVLEEKPDDALARRRALSIAAWFTEHGFSTVCRRCGVHRGWKTGCPQHPAEVLALTQEPVRVDESPFRSSMPVGPDMVPVGPRESSEAIFRRREKA